MSLAKNTQPQRIMDGVVAGTSDQTSDAVDRAGYDGVMFIGLLGTLTSGHATSMKIQQSSDDGGSDAYADLLGTGSGALAEGDSDQMIVIDIVRPLERYLKAILLRGTQNAVIDGIVAIPYNAKVTPTAQHSTVAKLEVHASPAEGTA